MKPVSIVINTYNRAKYIERTLKSLYYLDYDNFEVIVVNGPSTDNTQEIIDKYKKDIKIGYCAEANLSKSRNIGIAMAAGDYVAFIDDDAVPEPNWLNKLMEGFDDKEVAAVGGDVYNPTGKVFQIRKVISNRYGSLSEKAFDFPGSSQFTGVIGTNCIFNRKILIDLGGYNEQYDYFLDETEVCSRILDAGYLTKYMPDANIHHKFAPSYYRDERKIVLDYSKIMKNIIYFAKSYENICGQEKATRKITEQIDGVKAGALWAVQNGKISEQEYNACMQSLKKGIDSGYKDFARGYHLFISSETLERHKSKFKKFSNMKSKLKTLQKNIVYFSEDYPPYLNGGVGRFIFNLSKKVAKLGHIVHVVTNSHNGTDTIDFEDGVWVHRIVPKQYPYSLVSDIPFYSSNSYSKMNNIYSFYEELLHIHNRHKVDVVHSTIWASLGYYAMLDERFKTVMTLVTPFSNIYGDVYPRPAEYQFAIDLEADTLKRCSYIHADSKAIISEVEQYYPNSCNKNKTSVCYLGLEDISVGVKANKHKHIEILFTGRLEKRKAADVLLEAAAQICKKHKNVVFKFCGRNDILMPNSKMTYKEFFLNKYQNEDFLKNIIFTGFVSDDELKQAYADCDIYVSPSLYESFGLIFLEAMMFSKPVIGCDAGAMPEVIENKVTGLLAKPGDLLSLVECLERLICDEKLRVQMGKSGRQRYEQYFTADEMAKNMLKIYSL